MFSPKNQFDWDEENSPGSCAYIAPFVLKLVASLKVKRICDIGSGDGSLASLLYKQGYDIIGIEPDVEGYKISKKNYSEIDFYNFGVEDDPTQFMLFENKPFDLVISTEVVEHLFSPHLLPNYSKRILVSGGYLIISTPYYGYFKNLLISIFNRWDRNHTSLWCGGHIKFWSKKTITALLDECGFDVIKFYGVGRLPYLWKSMILVAKSR